MSQSAQFPYTRLRRLRQNAFSRQLVQETQLHTQDLIYPIFIQAGENTSTPIDSMPNIARMTIDALLIEAAECVSLGIPAIALFPQIEHHLKSDDAVEALNEDGLVPQAIRALKSDFPELGIIADVALDPYTTHGQDGLVEQGSILNDATIEVLSAQALCLANAGVDIVAPSDMMDGRIQAIRHTLEKAHHPDVSILAYSAKYASHFYDPFRDAVGSKASLGSADKRSYQMDPGNALEALREVEMDIHEGADIVMVKPAGAYLDVLYRIKQRFGMPTFAYQVSGEYAMQMAALEKGWLGFEAIEEALLGIKRAGADAILSYHAKQVARTLQER